MKNCVYRFLNKEKEIIYIGKAKDLKLRLNNHRHLPVECYNERHIIEFVEFDTLDDMEFAERYYIMKFKPKYNTILSDKNMNLSLIELDIKIWNTVTEHDDNESCNENYIDFLETKEHLINRIELIKQKILFARSFIRDNDINFCDEENVYVKNLNELINEEYEIELKLKKILIEEGHSEEIIGIFIDNGVYTKEEIINKELKKIEDEIYNMCENDILSYGYYKMNNYYNIEHYFAKSKSKSILSHFYDFRVIEYSIFKCNEINFEIRKDFANKIILNVEKRLVSKFGELKKEVLFLDGYSDFLSTIYPDYNFVTFQTPFIVFKPISQLKEND